MINMQCLVTIPFPLLRAFTRHRNKRVSERFKSLPFAPFRSNVGLLLFAFAWLGPSWVRRVACISVVEGECGRVNRTQRKVAKKDSTSRSPLLLVSLAKPIFSSLLVVLSLHETGTEECRPKDQKTNEAAVELSLQWEVKILSLEQVQNHYSQRRRRRTRKDSLL